MRKSSVPPNRLKKKKSSAKKNVSTLSQTCVRPIHSERAPSESAEFAKSTT